MLKQEMEKRDDVVFTHLVYEKSSYPDELPRMLGSVPAFIIVNPHAWEKGEVKGEIYGKHYDEKGQLVDDSYVKPPTVRNLLSWTDETVKLVTQ